MCRTLYINAYDRRPRDPMSNLSTAYHDFSRNGPTRVWLTLDDKTLGVNESDVELEELHLYGGAQIVFIKPNSPKSAISIVIGKKVISKIDISRLIHIILLLAIKNMQLCSDETGFNSGTFSKVKRKIF